MREISTRYSGLHCFLPTGPVSLATARITKHQGVKRHFSQWWDAVDDTPANRHLYTVEYELDELGDQELNGWQRPKRGRGRAQKSGK